MTLLIAKWWFRCDVCGHRFAHDEREADCPKGHGPAVLYGVQEELFPESDGGE